MIPKTDLKMLTLGSLQRHREPVNLHQIAAEVIMRGGFHPSSEDILEAIDWLRVAGYRIADDDSGIDRRYWLEPTTEDAA